MSARTKKRAREDASDDEVALKKSRLAPLVGDADDDISVASSSDVQSESEIVSSSWQSSSSSSSSISSSDDEASAEEDSSGDGDPRVHPRVATVEQMLAQPLEVEISGDRFKLRPHQEKMGNYVFKRMKLVKFDADFNVIEAPNHGIAGAEIIMQMGMGKTRQIFQTIFSYPQVAGPALVFESLTLMKELDDCLRDHFPKKYQKKVLFFHPDYIGTRYRTMTRNELMSYRAIVMTIESYSAMVFDYGFDKDVSEQFEMSDGTKRHVRYVNATYRQAMERRKHDYRGPAALMTMAFDMLMIDESHNIRTEKTRRSIALLTVFRLFTFLFTGTPMVNGLKDFWHQFVVMGYKGAPNMKTWLANFKEIQKRDRLVPYDVGTVEVPLEDRDMSLDESAFPLKCMTLAKDAPYLLPPKLHLEVVSLKYHTAEESAVNTAMHLIMKNLITAADNNKIHKKYVFAFWVYQNLCKIAPHLITSQSQRAHRQKPSTSTTTADDGGNQTFIGDAALNSYFEDGTLLAEAVNNIDVMAANVANNTTSFVTAPKEDVINEDKAVEVGARILDSMAPNLMMSQLLADRSGPMGIGSTIMQWIVNRIKDIHSREPNAKILIGTNYTRAADLISDTLKASLPATTGFVQIDGSVRGNRRTNYINAFKRDPHIKILISNMKIGSQGLNLTEANYVISTDSWYNKLHGPQFIARAWRPGQTKEVYAYDLSPDIPIEHHIRRLHSIKQESIEEFWNAHIKAEEDDDEDDDDDAMDVVDDDSQPLSAKPVPFRTNVNTNGRGGGLTFDLIREINDVKPKQVKKGKMPAIPFPPPDPTPAVAVNTHPPPAQQPIRMMPNAFSLMQQRNNNSGRSRPLIQTPVVANTMLRDSFSASRNMYLGAKTIWYGQHQPPQQFPLPPPPKPAHPLPQAPIPMYKPTPAIVATAVPVIDLTLS